MPDSQDSPAVQPDPPAAGLELPPEPAQLPLTPVARQERIAIMDVLRGIAVFGIFLINMPLYVAPSGAFFGWENNAFWTSTEDRMAVLFIYIFAQGKFYTLFSFLFGAGFGVQMTRAAARNSPAFLATYRRRLLVLLGIGILHFTLVWWGDVLHVYALLGFVLILFRNRGDGILLRWVAGLIVIPVLISTVVSTIQHYTDTQTPEAVEKSRTKREASRKQQADDIRIKSSGSFPQILMHRLRKDLQQLGGELGWSIELLTNFLLGLWAVRHGVLQRPREHLPLLRKFAYVALPSGLLLTAADLLYAYLHPMQEQPPLWHSHLTMVREFVARPAVAYGYAAVLLLIGVRGWMGGIAAVGRMALTNYLLHSLVFTTVANSYGLGLYGTIHPPMGLLLCILFYGLQIPFSMWWLSRHPYGPFEWLWRSLTYGVRQPWKMA